MPLNLDLPTVLHFNSLIPQSPLAAKILSFPVSNELLRNVPFFLSLVTLWFVRDRPEQRAKMLTGLLGVSLATAISVVIQAHVWIHLHPSIDPTIVLRGHGTDLLQEKFDRINSFPSDTATFYFGLSTVVFLQSRRAGLLLYAWSLCTAGFLRIALGWHYPSDVLAGIFLGALTVVLVSRIRIPDAVFERILNRMDGRIYIVHACLFLYLADAYSFFPGLQGIMRGIGMFSRAAFKH
jgi:membrane-associated phospholipid phosphatase